MEVFIIGGIILIMVGVTIFNLIFLKKGKEAYQNLDKNCLAVINSIDAVPVQRNSGIDGFLKEHIDGGSVS